MFPISIPYTQYPNLSGFRTAFWNSEPRFAKLRFAKLAFWEICRICVLGHAFWRRFDDSRCCFLRFVRFECAFWAYRWHLKGLPWIRMRSGAAFWASQRNMSLAIPAFWRCVLENQYLAIHVSLFSYISSNWQAPWVYPLLGCPKLVPIRVPSWCQSGLRFGPTAGSLFLLRFGCWSRQQAMACHGRVFNLRFDCVLNRFVYPSRSKLAFWSCVLNSVICVPEPCVSVLRAKGTKIGIPS